MKRIQKGREPESLKRHRPTPFATYANYEARDELRRALLEEQGYICCYCMQRISAADMKIEHWAPQSGREDLQLVYGNLLGACRGAEGEVRSRQHCDTHKGNTEITVNPASETMDCERLVHYLPNGEVTSHDAIVREDLQATLNLNTEQLKRNRKSVIDTLVRYLSSKQKSGSWPPAFLRLTLASWKNRGSDGMYQEYCRVVVYYLEKKMKQKGQ
jgi:uncharacterized protein (TIGR02646 family)